MVGFHRTSDSGYVPAPLIPRAHSQLFVLACFLFPFSFVSDYPPCPALFSSPISAFFSIFVAFSMPSYFVVFAYIACFGRSFCANAICLLESLKWFLIFNIGIKVYNSGNTGDKIPRNNTRRPHRTVYYHQRVYGIINYNRCLTLQSKMYYLSALSN